MNKIDQSRVQNILLQRISPQAFDALRYGMEAVVLPVKMELIAPGKQTSHVYFLGSGLASLVAASKDEEIEVGHIGREGMAGVHTLLKVDQTPNRTFMQIAGDGIRVPTSLVHEVMSQHVEASDLLLRYVQFTVLQLAYSALANARYKMPERLSRWLLMCHDRVDSDNIPLTHDFLSLMLGVRRAGVTDELHVLEGLGAIRSTRGNVQVLNRQRLEELAGGSYGAPEREYERLIGAGLER
jgi:CRP-like cAMP-binding protein